MTKKLKRVMAAILAVAMISTLIPAMPVHADETYNEVYAYNLEEIRLSVCDFNFHKEAPFDSWFYYIQKLIKDKESGKESLLWKGSFDVTKFMIS